MDNGSPFSSGELKRGDQFGKYSLLERIGRGGEATVWSAWDHLRQRVLAIKLVPRGGDEAETGSLHISSGFEHQIHLIASLNHPNILPLYEFGETGYYYYFVMRYGCAGSLANRLAHRRFTLEETIHFCVQIASALQHLHERKIIHRDLKPSNIMLDTQDRVYLSDFGLSKNLNQETVPLHTGRGTGPYAPYEQFARMEVSVQSDIFSFGVMMYEMLTGDLPWEGAESLAVRQAKAFEELPPVQTLDAGLAPIITAVLRQWTAFQPEHRPVSAREALDMLVDAVREKKGRQFPIPAPLPPNLEEGIVLAQDASELMGRFINHNFAERQPFPLRLTHLALVDAALRPGLPHPIPLDDRLRLWMLRGAMTYNHNVDFWFRLANTTEIRWQACQSVIINGDETATKLALERWLGQSEPPPENQVAPDLWLSLLDWVDRAQTWPVRQAALEMLGRLAPSHSHWQETAFSVEGDRRLAQLALEHGPLSEPAARLLGRMHSLCGLKHLLEAHTAQPTPHSHQALFWMRQASGGFPKDVPLPVRLELAGSDFWQRVRDENLPVYPAGGGIGLLVGLLTSILFILGFFAPYRLAAQDALMRNYPVSNITTIIEIDDSSLEQYGRWADWPRDLHAQLITRLHDMGARAIVLDYIFAGATPNDASLVQAIQSAGVVVQPVLGQGDAILDTAGAVRYRGIVTPRPEFAGAAAALGHTNVMHDVDGVVRKMPVMITSGTLKFPSLPIAALQVYLGGTQAAQLPAFSADTANIVGRTAPVGPYSELWVHFAGPPANPGYSTFRNISFTELMNGSAPASWIKDRLVLVGITATAEPDRYLTPVSQGRPMYGVEILANEIETIWSGRFLQPAPNNWRIALIIILAILAGLFSRSPVQSAIASLALSVIAFTVAALAFDWMGWQFDLFFPVVGILFSAVVSAGVRYAVVNRRYQMIRSDLRQRAGPEVQQAAMQALRNDHVSLQQKLQEVTVLSINLSEFNHLAGQASPDRAQNIKDALERVLRTAALENGGTLLEVSGNTWAAVFNVPILQTDHPARAITAALQAHRQWEIERLALPDQDPARQIELPMGICIGRSLVGYALIREDGRASHQFQAMGEAVELAVQLCHFAASDQILLCGQGAESLEEENKIEVFSSWYVPGLKTSVLTYIVYPTE